MESLPFSIFSTSSRIREGSITVMKTHPVVNTESVNENFAS